jgi:hypothetical protein
VASVFDNARIANRGLWVRDGTAVDESGIACGKLEHMFLKKSAADARKLVLSIPHKRCANAMTDNWKVEADGMVRAQSVFWLFCWAKTGMNSEHARQVAVRVFDEILPISFVAFDAIVNHEYARKARYASHNIEHELEGFLAQRQPR